MAAAAHLAESGLEASVIDKAGRAGGRAAFGRLGTELVRQAFDEGELRAAGVDVITAPDWRGAPVRKGLLSRLHAAANGIELELATPSERIPAEVVLLTAPLPQSLRILERSGISFSPRFFDAHFDRRLVLNARGADGSLHRVVLAAEESRERWDDDRNFLALDIAAEHGISEPVEASLKAWRYANCLAPIDYPFAEIAVPSGRLLLAGDAFCAASGLQGLRRAFDSGQAAAEAVLRDRHGLPPRSAE